MSKGDSLEAIDRDLKEVMDFCISSGLSSSQIASGARPLLAAAKSSQREAWIKNVILVSVVVGFVAFLFQNTWTYGWICIIGKLLAMKVLPYWDWTLLYEEDCIIRNPYMVVNKLTEDDCESCVNYTTMDLLSNTTFETVAEGYLFTNLPFIVTDASQDWKASSDFSVDSLKKLYTENEVLRSHDVCQYKDSKGHSLIDVLSGQATSFHAVWANCNLPAIKVIRSYYQRPYFLPPMVEAAADNIVAMSSGSSGDTDDEDTPETTSRFLHYNVYDDVTWFAQIRGNYLIQLRPKSPCDDICIMFEFVLQQGETMVVTNEMWEWHFTPADSSPTIAIGSSGNWDA